MRNIMFCGNSKVFDGVLTCMLSIFKRTETTEPFSITILTMDVSHLNPDYTCIDDNMISFLDKVAKSYNAANEETYCSIREMADFVAKEICHGNIKVTVNTF